MPFHDLVDIVGGDVPVPDRVRIDDHRAAMLAVVQAPGLVGADSIREPARLERRLELLVQLLAPLLRAGASWMAGPAVVQADEDVLREGRAHWGTPVPSSFASVERKALAGSGPRAISKSSPASSLPWSTDGSPAMARSVSRRGALAASATASPPSASDGARAATARFISSALVQTTHASMWVARAAPHRRASDSPGSSDAWSRTASAPAARDSWIWNSSSRRSARRSGTVPAFAIEARRARSAWGSSATTASAATSASS